MTEIIIGIAMSIITQLAKKLDLNPKIIIAGLSIVLWTAYYFLKMYYPDTIEDIIQKVLGAYGMSQIVYNYIIEIFIENKPLTKKD